MDYSTDNETNTSDVLGQGGGPRERGVTLSRGLSIKNKVTGEVIETDTHTIRISRMRKRVRAWAELMKGLDQSKVRAVMVTLTYRGVDDWRPNHIRDFMVKYRRAIKGDLHGYAWVAELQRRGAVHYHIILVVSRGTQVPKPDGYWSYGLTRIETARTVYYIAKYTGKEYQKGGEGIVYPVGLRMFAVWVSRGAVDPLRYFSFRISAFPSWLGAIVASVASAVVKLPARRPGGGWLFAGKVYRSPYIVQVKKNFSPVLA